MSSQAPPCRGRGERPWRGGALRLPDRLPFVQLTELDGLQTAVENRFADRDQRLDTASILAEARRELGRGGGREATDGGGDGLVDILNRIWLKQVGRAHAAEALAHKASQAQHERLGVNERAVDAREDVTETRAGRGSEGALGALDGELELVAGIPGTIQRAIRGDRYDG